MLVPDHPQAPIHVNRLSGILPLSTEPRIVAFGGGGGGIGRSTIAAETARALVRRGRRVVLVDADPTNPSQLLRFGVPAGEHPRVPDHDAELTALLVKGDRARPDILSLAHVLPAPYRRRALDGPDFVARLRRLDADVVLLDLPAYADPTWTRLFVLSDMPVVVAATEATSLLAAERYLRHALVYALLHCPGEGSDRVLEQAIERLPHDFDTKALARALCDPLLTARLARTRATFASYLCLTRTREVSERDLAHVIALIWQHRLGHRPRVLQPIGQDERRWFHIRQDETAPAMSADGGFGGEIEELAKQLWSIEEVDAAQPRDESAAPTAHFGVADDAPAHEVRQAYRRLWEGLRRESSVTRQLLDRTERDALVQALEDTNRDAQSWLSERDKSTVKAMPAIRQPLPRFDPGEVLRDARQRAGLALRELSLQTKIGVSYLEAIEAFDLGALPRPVYLRGYLREIARCLNLDSDRVLDDYLTAVSESRAERLRRENASPGETA